MAEQVPTSNTICPQTLYAQCLRSYAGNLNYNVRTMDSVQQLRYLPPGVLIDVYLKMSQQPQLLDMLFAQFSDLDIFERLLRFDPARQKLFRCLTALLSLKKSVVKQLQENFTNRYRGKFMKQNTGIICIRKSTKCTKSPAQKINCEISDNECNITLRLDQTKQEKENAQIMEVAETLAALDTNDNYFGFDVIDLGLRLGSFLSEAGWLSDSIEVLACVAAKLRTMKMDYKMLTVRLDCLQRLLHSEAALCSFKAAERTFDEAIDLLKQVTPEKELPQPLLANTYTQFSAMYFARSEYDDSHMWSVVAMRYLDDNTPERIAIDVLRQAAKACVVKRDYQRANMLICQATRRAMRAFGHTHQKYADTLLDYGFFLLNVDSIFQSVNLYTQALDIKRSIFGNHNFHVAVAHEDLSYAYYVHEYGTGNFTYAREHVEKAIDIMKDLVPNDHLMLASAKRVKALVLEEIALDKMPQGPDVEGLLQQSEELHQFALQLSLEVFGEINVQTAKHYGNLGRLYQTMNRFEEAERMHQKAIQIKTKLLGPYDYEVGLSIGHLASLYNFQMKKYREAEEFYLRSIEISLRLFGRSYSGLEYDYLGLCHVYETLHEFEKYVEYANILENWKYLRGQNISMNKSIYPAINEDCSLEDVKYKFFNMCTLNITACN